MDENEKLKEIKTKISELSGVPAEYISGNNADECIEYTKALIEYKNTVGQDNKSTEEKFADWLSSQMSCEHYYVPCHAPDSEVNGTHNVEDGGEPYGFENKDKLESFEEWLSEALPDRPIDFLL